MLKFQSPIFKQMSDKSTNVIKKGKLKFEIVPRGTTREGDIDPKILHYDNSVSMALSAESVGQLLIDLSNKRSIKLTHEQVSLSSTPVRKGSHKFCITVGRNSEEVLLSAGEIEVIKMLIKHSIPQLVAWDNIIQNSFDDVMSETNVDNDHWLN